jgi:hypothetical protein
MGDRVKQEELHNILQAYPYPPFEFGFDAASPLQVAPLFHPQTAAFHDPLEFQPVFAPQLSQNQRRPCGDKYDIAIYLRDCARIGTSKNYSGFCRVCDLKVTWTRQQVSGHKLSGRCIGQSESDYEEFKKMLESTLPETGLLEKRGAGQNFCGEPGCDHSKAYKFASLLSLKHSQPVHKKRIAKTITPSSKKQAYPEKNLSLPETGLYARVAAGIYTCAEPNCTHSKTYRCLSTLSLKHTQTTHMKRVIKGNNITNSFPLDFENTLGVDNVLRDGMDVMIDMETLDYNMIEEGGYDITGYHNGTVRFEE